ncbi:indole-3-glycerol phosphate synthase TrpC [Cysteiniphilum halobium]|uniref:indole-3-glycerol phosphate synthase TrpC n=1 Tax=Cysteiniphilum halobium TaxID=2219059 RepID=UPI000E649F6E|nr:indole-3-glycerol phosphate synthase TrpC [Cysteiniphilum halobium]
MILQKIIESKRQELKLLPDPTPAALTPAKYDFLQAIKTHKPAIIAELKPKSPSEGIIDPNYDPITIAKAYQAGGACALSILTDKPFFGGSFEDIRKIRDVVTIPILCKEFIIDEKQIYQARLNGADACLLIVRCLDKIRLQELIQCVESLNMTALVEVFDEEETEMALACNAKLIGVNNRNLDTLEMDTDNIARLQKRIPKNITLLSLSGAKTPSDLHRFGCTYDGVLAGTALMRARDKVGFLQEAINATTP